MDKGRSDIETNLPAVDVYCPADIEPRGYYSSTLKEPEDHVCFRQIEITLIIDRRLVKDVGNTRTSRKSLVYLARM